MSCDNFVLLKKISGTFEEEKIVKNGTTKSLGKKQRINHASNQLTTTDK